jgi:hypothetical protein
MVSDKPRFAGVAVKALVYDIQGVDNASGNCGERDRSQLRISHRWL